MTGFEAGLAPYSACRRIAAKSVLVLAPHADDEVLGCGGAILRHVDDGVPVRVVVVTDGAFGLAGANRVRQAALRRSESEAAAELLGYGTPTFWDLPDQGVICGERLVRAVAEAIADADLVYAPSPFEIHPDHRALSLAAAEALRGRAGVRLAFYEVGAALRPNVLLDISDLAERKQAAVACFRSQLAVQSYDRHAQALNAYRTYTAGPTVSAAEAFWVVEASDVDDGPLALYRAECEVQRAAARRLIEPATPLVSVIVRTMGRPSLKEALETVAAQTYPNLEVVLVHARGAACRAAPACRALTIRNVIPATPLGRGAAANAGLEAAGGELLMFLDEDDLMMPEHVAGLVETLGSADGALAAHAGVQVVTEAGVVDTYDAPVERAALRVANRLPINAVLFHRSLVDEGRRFDEALELYEDWDFWLQISERTVFARRPGVSALYRVHLGTSGLFGPDADALAARWRGRVLGKWAARWSPEETAGLTDRLHASERARAAAEATVCELRRLLEQAWADVRAREEMVAARDGALSAAVLQAQDLQRTVGAIRRSLSWRATAPVRWVIDSARRARGGGHAR